MNNPSFCAFLTILTLLFASVLYAQEETTTEAGGGLEDFDLIMEDEGITLEEDLPSSPALPQTDVYGGKRNVVSAEDIHEQGSMDFLDALRNVPGVMFSKRNLIGTNTGTSLYVRGRGYTHPSLETTVTFDGVPRSGLIYGQTMADSISVFTAGSLEVFKSPTPSSFGAGYAAVNVVPRYQDTQGWTAESGFTGDSFHTLGENISFGLRRGPFDIYAAESYIATVGHTTYSGAYQKNLYLNAGFWINAYWNIRALFNYTDSKTLQPPGEEQGKSEALATFGTETYFTTLTVSNEFDSLNGFIKGYFNYTNFLWLDENPVVRTDYSRQLLGGSGFRVKETYSFLENGSVSAGLDLDINLTHNEDHNTFPAKSVYTHFPITTLLSSYAAASYTFYPGGDFFIIPQGAFRYFANSVWDNSFSPQAGVTAGWRFLEIAGIYSGGVIYPAPAIIQSLIDSGNLDSMALKSVKPETVHHYEGSVSVNTRMFSTNFAYFYDDGRNRIIASGLALGNVSSVAYFIIQGFEAGGLLKISPAFFLLQGLELSGSFSWITSIRAKGETGPEVTTMPYTPRLSAAGSLRWETSGGFTLGGDFQFLKEVYAGNLTNSASYTEISPSRRLPDILLINLRLSWNFSHKPWRLSKGELYAQVNNALNRRYEYYQGYEMPGISFTLGTSIAFGR
jgi:iron complex outermembrane receptor protein